VLIAAAVAISAIAPDSILSGLSAFLAWLWVAATVCLLAWRLWRWMTYRVGARLFVTYFMIGVLPVIFAVAFAAIGVYILMGQYTSVRLGSELRRVRMELVHQCELVLQRAQLEGAAAAESLLDQISTTYHEPFPEVYWQARFGQRRISLIDESDLPEVDWVAESRVDVNAHWRDRAFRVVSAASDSGDRVTALIPLDRASARAVSEAWWFDVAFLTQGAEGAPGSTGVDDDEIQVSSDSSPGMTVTVSGRQMDAGELWPPWKDGDAGWFSQPFVVWFRVAVDVVDLETGKPTEEGRVVALLRTSPVNVWRDFTLSRYELGKELWGVLGVLAALFLIGYGVALATAAAVVISITRSTSRLTAGARAVESGDLGHRVPVKRRDQLGELARSFNHMTDSVQSMLAEVSEKERLARELELAREIQESLLPARHLEVGPMSVRATFHPATEVGGDYFDVFPVSDDKLVVAIGDVAGHGLSTGLLMASLKSSVAALVHEGYRGRDLIEKVNRLLMEHGKARTIVTLAVVEIGLGEARLALANAGHCPAILIHPNGKIEELAAGSAPMGSRLCRPTSIEAAFSSGSRMVLYSDGLVEATSPAGEPFGYDRLMEILQAASEVSGTGLTKDILDHLADHSGGVALSDDLTILVVERNS
jgi:HAMP domain-containing protein